MAYIVGIDRNQTRMVTTSLDALIDEDNSVRVIDAYVDSLDLIELGFKEYSGTNRGQRRYRLCISRCYSSLSGTDTRCK